MESIIRFFSRQKAFANAITIVVIVFGIWSLFNIKREAFPNITYNVLQVQTFFPGASAEEVERLVTNSIEQDIREVSGIKRITSISVEGRSLIFLQLDPDTGDLKSAKDDVQVVLDRLTNFPEGAENPVVQELSSKFEPTIEIGLSGDLSDAEIRAHARNLERNLERIEGTARVDILGLRDIEIKIIADPDKLRYYNVTLPEIMQVLSGQNLNIPGGTFEVAGKDGPEEFVIRTLGEFQSVTDVENVVIRANSLGEVVSIRDVARVEEGFEDAKIYYRTNAQSGLSLVVLKKEEADAITLVDQVKEAVEAYRLDAGSGLGIAYINDFSFFIRRRIGVLGGNLIVGLILVLLVLSLSLPFRAAFITSFGIPFSFLGTILVFYFAGVSVNLLSLLGLIIVVGMLVDDAVVVAENCQRYQDLGHSAEDATVKGVMEVLKPVLFSIATTIAAFSPMLFMTGIMGKFIAVIPIGVIVALLVSLFEAFFILPNHFSSWKFLGKGEAISPDRIKEFPAIARPYLWASHRFQEIFLSRWIPRYMALMKHFLRRRYLVMVGLVAFTVVTIVVANFRLKFILFPPGGVEAFVVNLEGPDGVSLEEMREIVKPAEKIVMELPKTEMKDFTTKVGEWRLNLSDPNGKAGSQYAQMVVHLTPETDRVRTAEEIADSLRPQLDAIARVKKVHVDQVSGGPPVGAPVNLGVRGRTYEQINEAVKVVSDYLASIEGVKGIQNSFVLGKKELHVSIDSREAAAAGLTVRDVGTTVRAAYEGLVATSIKRLDEEIDLRVQLDREGRNQARLLQDILIPNARGNLIPLGRIATVREDRGIASYEHEANERQVEVTAQLDLDLINSVEANRLLRTQIPEWQKKFPGITFYFGGEDKDMQESMESLGQAALAAFFIIFMILIIAFGNFYQPFFVAIAIPMGGLAVLWTFMIHNRPLSFLAMIGLVALAGVIVNNSIVLVDFINRLRLEGRGKYESILEGCQTRLRPIFLTSFTTVVGILPTAYGIGGLDPFVMPVALALGWGLLFGSVLTLLVLPPILAIGDDIEGLVTKLFRRS